jgi:choline dehydrogenase-like flavoprotein
MLRAKRGVIVAASCTHSPALLIRSGLKLPALGRYFQAHPGTGVFGVYDEPVDMSRGATQGWASIEYRQSEGFKLETLSLPVELVASRLSGGGQQLMERIQRFPYIAMWVAAVRAETVGRVKTNWSGQPVVHYAMTHRDMKRLRSGLHKVARVHVAAGAKRVIPGVYGLPYELAADDIDQIMNASLDPRHYVGILSHLFGGCVMGSDPQKAVCDAHGQVYGTEGLFISDASQIPTTLGVNPQHTIMALARHRAAELLKRE